MRRGEQAIFYTRTRSTGVAGICKVVKTAEPDPTQFDPTSNYYDAASKPADPRWDWVTVAPVRALPFVSLDELRTWPEPRWCGCSVWPRGTACRSCRSATQSSTRSSLSTARRHFASQVK